jgi:hypothetical protein
MEQKFMLFLHFPIALGWLKQRRHCQQRMGERNNPETSVKQHSGKRPHVENKDEHERDTAENYMKIGFTKIG